VNDARQCCDLRTRGQQKCDRSSPITGLARPPLVIRNVSYAEASDADFGTLVQYSFPVKSRFPSV
jgi:hypothetical protein